MKKYSSLEYLKLTKIQRFFYKIACFFVGIPLFFKKIGLAIVNFFKKVGLAIKNEVVDIVMTFVDGDWKTKLSYPFMGFGSIARKQYGRGVLFALFEIIFIVYMALAGGYWLSMMPSLGKIGPHPEYDPVWDEYIRVPGDNSFKILLYSVLTIFFILAFLYTWRLNVKQNKIAEEIVGTMPKKRLQKECAKKVKAFEAGQHNGLTEEEISGGH